MEKRLNNIEKSNKEMNNRIEKSNRELGKRYFEKSKKTIKGILNEIHIKDFQLNNNNLYDLEEVELMKRVFNK